MRPRLDVVPRSGQARESLALRLTNVDKRFGSRTATVQAIERVCLELRRGEFVCLVGASGCGKTTLLNIVAGLDTATTGTVERFDSRTALIFQEAALFPWLTVEQNVAFPMRVAGVPRAERQQRALELLEIVRLVGFARHRPHQISGGMRQRVALARALAQRADLLLMDEPFAALDALMRDHLYDELERVVAVAKLTVLFVTHNVREAVRLGDRVVLLSSRPGRIVREFAIEVPRPRRIESPDVAAQARIILDHLREESSHV